MYHINHLFMKLHILGRISYLLSLRLASEYTMKTPAKNYIKDIEATLEGAKYTATVLLLEAP